MIKRIKLCFLAAAILFAALSITISAENDLGVDLSLAKSVCVLNTDSGLVILSKAADSPTQPVGSAKIMTAILAFEHYKGNFDEVITIPEEATEISAGYMLGLVPGEELSVDVLLRALVAGGANDAANVLALEIAGSIDAFCEMMNKKAAELGAVNTVFKNANGLDAEGATTTAKDVALIAEYAYRIPEFTEYSMIYRYDAPDYPNGDARSISNRNFLLHTRVAQQYYNPKAIGLNHGSTDLGGYCTITCTENDGLTYIIVVMNATEDENGDYASFHIASDLINKVPSRFGYKTVLDANSLLIEVPVKLGKNADYVIASPKTKAEYFLENSVDVQSEISYKTTLTKEILTAPVHEGETVGSVDVIYRNETIATVDLVAKSTVSASTTLRFFDYAKKLLKTKQAKIAIAVFAVLFISYLILSYMNFVRTHKNKH